MEMCVADLQNDCKEIERWIDIERSKLSVLKSELEEWINKDDIQVEKWKIRKIGKETERVQKRVKSLTTECNALLKVIVTVEKDTVQAIPKEIEELRTTLNKVIDDTELAEDEIYHMEEKIRQMKEQNACLEKELRKKFSVNQAMADKEREIRLFESRKQEEDATFILEDLQRNLKKATDDLRRVKFNLRAVYAECKIEERRYDQIMQDFTDMEKMLEKMKKEEERAKSKIISQRAG